MIFPMIAPEVSFSFFFDNIGLGHDELNNEIDFYWDDEDGENTWTISTLYDGEEDLDEEVETEEDVLDVLKYVSENIEMFNCDEEYEEEDED